MENKLSLQRHMVKLMTLLFVSVSFPVIVQAQKVIMVIGEVDGPPSLKQSKEKTTLQVGDLVSVPAGSLVILETTWPSDDADHPCLRWDYIKGPPPVKVVSNKKPGSCPIENNPKDCHSPACMAASGQLFFYAPAKEDTSTAPPPRVTESIKQMNRFYEALRKMKKERETP